MNDPNEDGFVGPTRALFERTQLIIKTIYDPTSWLTLTSRIFLQPRQCRPGTPVRFCSGRPRSSAITRRRSPDFCRRRLTPIENLIFVAGGRFDHFNQFGEVWTYRFAGSYKIDKTNTTLHSSVATGFSPPSSQDKIFGNNFGLKPEHDLGWDIGIEQRLLGRRVTVGLTYFHNDLSNVIGFNGLFQTLNLGAAETQGLEAELRAQPIADLVFTASLHLSRSGENFVGGYFAAARRAFAAPATQ